MKYNIGLPGGPSGPFYSVVAETGEVIAMQVTSKENAERIAKAFSTVDDATVDPVPYYLHMAIEAMKVTKGDNRNEFTRKCQILITDAEKVAGLWDSWISRYEGE